MQHSTTFNWSSAAINAFNAFESPQNPAAQQPAITFPPSAYDPTFFQARYFTFGTGPNDPSAAVNANQMDHSPILQPMNGMENGRSPWGGFSLNQGFSSNDGYSGPPIYDDEETSFQYIKLPSRHTLPIVPIYDTLTPALGISQTEFLKSSNLYPEPAMPLTVKHPEFTEQQTKSKDVADWTAMLMEDIGRMEAKSTQQNTAPPRQALTLQSPSDLHSQAQARLQQESYYNSPRKVEGKIFEMESDPVSEIYEATAFLHDFIAEDRLNNGAKEMVSLPSAIPSIPSLSVRTPAPRLSAHPYSSPRLGPLGSPRMLIGGGFDRRGSARSVRPIVRVKREPGPPLPAPLTTAYLAGLRRPIPLSAMERTPDDPYPRAHGITYPLSIGANAPAGGFNSASTATASLPSESPFSPAHSLISGVIESPMTRRGSIVGMPSSPSKEHAVPINNGEGSLRLHRGASSREQNRPSTGTTAERLQTQSRATASRKRADDDLISCSFRGEEDWRRRAVLDNVLAAQFLADNVMEPNNSGAGDPLTMGMGAEGKSIYAVFLEQVERSQWRCLFGDKEHPCGSHAISFKRLERALDHVRSHLNHRPFVCKGECQKGESCDARFFARSHLQDHVKRTESACCETCGQVIRIQNMPRHRLAH